MTNSQTDLVISEARDRIKKNLIIDFADFNPTIPQVGIFDEPTRCYRINKEWAKIVIGFLDWLTETNVWKDAKDESYPPIQAILDFMVGEDCVPPEIPNSNCIRYLPYSSAFSYFPQNPFSQPDYLPSGYLASPFVIAGINYPTIINDFGDIVVRWESFPINANWFDIIFGFLPVINFKCTGIGQAEIKLQNQPFGGRVGITINRPLNVIDMFVDGILDTGAIFVELDQDFGSFPGESIFVTTKEIEFDVDELHEIHITFCPTLDDSLLPFRFGGTLKGIDLCGLTPVAQSENIVNDVRLTGCNLEALVDGQWVVKGDILSCIQPLVDNLQGQVDSNDVDIADLETLSTNLQNQINDNIDDIDSLVLGQTSQQLQINTHGNRISVLEATVAHLAQIESEFKISSYEVYINAGQLVSGNVWTDVSSTLYQHVFTYNRALCVIEFKGKSGIGQSAYYRLKVGNQVGSIEATILEDDIQSVQLSEVFDSVQGSQNIQIQMQGALAGHDAVIGNNQNLVAYIIEYQAFESTLNDPVVTFDNGGAPYELSAANIGLVSVGGNPLNALIGTNLNPNQYIEIEVDIGEVKTLDEINLDIYSSDMTNVRLSLYDDNGAITSLYPSSLSDNQWNNYAVPSAAFPRNTQFLRVRLQNIGTGASILADVRMDNISVQTTDIVPDTITFDAGTIPYSLPAGQSGFISSGGNSGDCLYAQGLNQWQYIGVEWDLGEPKLISDIVFDANSDSGDTIGWELYLDGGLYFVSGTAFPLAWTQLSFDNQFSVFNQPVLAQTIEIRFVATQIGGASAISIDNIRAII